MQLLGLIGDDQERGEKFVYDETLVQDPPSEVKMKPNERKEIIHSACSVASLASEVCHGQQEEVMISLLTCYLVCIITIMHSSADLWSTS